jgi:serine/threonine protein kinase
MSAAQVSHVDPGKIGWGFQEGDEIAPGLHALRLLGGGVRFEAYLAFDERLHYLVVVKALRPDQIDDSSAIRGLRREAEILGAKNHPVLSRLLDSKLEGDRPHLVLEFVEGPRLSTLLRRFGTLEVDQAAPLGIELASALHYLHGTGTVHLDVKPKNIIMGAPPRLIDLSVARSAALAEATDHPVGTDAYMAPEQCAPHRLGPMGPAADVWGLGVTLFESVAGRLPFDRGVDDERASEEARFPQLLQERAPLPEDVAAPLSRMIVDCLEPDPVDRPSPQEVAERLQPLLDRPRKVRLNHLRPR